MKNTHGIAHRARSQKAAGGFDKITRPYQVISAKVFIAFVEAPRDRKTCDDAAEKIFGFMGAQHGCASAIKIGLSAAIKWHKHFLPIFPLRNIIAKEGVVIIQQTGARLLGCLRPNSSEAECKNKFAVAGCKINLSSERNIAIFRTWVFVRKQKIACEALRTIGVAGKSGRHFLPRTGARQCQGKAA